MSLLTLQLIGHLFDTHCFNRAIDACEQQEVQFRVLNLELGLTEDSPSKVAIQIMCKDKNALNAALDSINLIAEQCKVKLYHSDQEEDGYDGQLNEQILSIDKD